jgi:hypothetical protein
MYYQLFSTLPPLEFIEDFLKLFVPNGFDENYFFTKKSCEDKNIIAIINDKYIDQLKQYYLPCKFNIFLNDLTFKKSITILRHLLKHHNYKIVSHQKNHCNKKYLIYNIKKNKINNTESNFLIQFD